MTTATPTNQEVSSSEKRYEIVPIISGKRGTPISFECCEYISEGYSVHGPDPYSYFISGCDKYGYETMKQAVEFCKVKTLKQNEILTRSIPIPKPTETKKENKTPTPAGKAEKKQKAESSKKDQKEESSSNEEDDSSYNAEMFPKDTYIENYITNVGKGGIEDKKLKSMVIYIQAAEILKENKITEFRPAQIKSRAIDTILVREINTNRKTKKTTDVAAHDNIMKSMKLYQLFVPAKDTDDEDDNGLYDSIYKLSPGLRAYLDKRPTE